MAWDRGSPPAPLPNAPRHKLASPRSGSAVGLNRNRPPMRLRSAGASSPTSAPGVFGLTEIKSNSPRSERPASHLPKVARAPEAVGKADLNGVIMPGEGGESWLSKITVSTNHQVGLMLHALREVEGLVDEEENEIGSELTPSEMEAAEQICETARSHVPRPPPRHGRTPEAQFRRREPSPGERRAQSARVVAPSPTAAIPTLNLEQARTILEQHYGENGFGPLPIAQTERISIADIRRSAMSNRSLTDRRTLQERMEACIMDELSQPSRVAAMEERRKKERQRRRSSTRTTRRDSPSGDSREQVDHVNQWVEGWTYKGGMAQEFTAEAQRERLKRRQAEREEHAQRVQSQRELRDQQGRQLRSAVWRKEREKMEKAKVSRDPKTHRMHRLLVLISLAARMHRLTHAVTCEEHIDHKARTRAEALKKLDQLFAPIVHRKVLLKTRDKWRGDLIERKARAIDIVKEVLKLEKKRRSFFSAMKSFKFRVLRMQRQWRRYVNLKAFRISCYTLQFRRMERCILSGEPYSETPYPPPCGPEAHKPPEERRKMRRVAVHHKRVAPLSAAFGRSRSPDGRSPSPNRHLRSPSPGGRGTPTPDHGAGRRGHVGFHEDLPHSVSMQSVDSEEGLGSSMGSPHSLSGPATPSRMQREESPHKRVGAKYGLPPGVTDSMGSDQFKSIRGASTFRNQILTRKATAVAVTPVPKSQPIPTEKFGEIVEVKLDGLTTSRVVLCRVPVQIRTYTIMTLYRKLMANILTKITQRRHERFLRTGTGREGEEEGPAPRFSLWPDEATIRRTVYSGMLHTEFRPPGMVPKHDTFD